MRVLRRESPVNRVHHRLPRGPTDGRVPGGVANRGRGGVGPGLSTRQHPHRCQGAGGCRAGSHCEELP